jgi:centromere/kinetochore protein ZW10
VVAGNVSNWQKMIDLQFVLDTSLVAITEQWKSGKLPQSFKAEEIKHLIRALFQNTDRRANALSAIV